MKTAVPVDNTAGNRWESILSRKINVSSMKRHFAAFKQRDFVIDRPNFSLGVKTVDAKSSKTTVLKIALDSPSMKLQRHHYAEDMKPCISISYFDKDASSEIEIMMKFESESDLERWFSVSIPSIFTKYSNKKTFCDYDNYDKTVFVTSFFILISFFTSPT